jgi:hypothetical protein
MEKLGDDEWAVAAVRALLERVQQQLLSEYLLMAYSRLVQRPRR